MHRFHLLVIASATLFFRPPAPAGEMAMSNSALARASETKRIGGAESASGCEDMNGGEMAMMRSYPMPFGIMTGEAGKWMVGYRFMHENMDGSLFGTHHLNGPVILKQFPNG